MTLRQTLARIRRSPAATDLRTVAPYLGAVLVAVAVFPGVELLCEFIVYAGPVQAALVFWVPAALVLGIVIGLFIRLGQGPPTA